MTVENRPNFIRRIGKAIGDEVCRYFFVFTPEEIKLLKQSEEEWIPEQDGTGGNTSTLLDPPIRTFGTRETGINLHEVLGRLMPTTKGKVE